MIAHCHTTHPSCPHSNVRLWAFFPYTFFVNELFLVVLALFDVGIMLMMFALGREWLFGCITVNLLLVSLMGGKLVPLLGHVTNLGNVFYAMVFFATYLLLEYGTDAVGPRIIWTGAIAITLFTVLTQTSLFVDTAPQSISLSIALREIFTVTPRIAFASVIAFVCAQLVNIFVFNTVRRRVRGAGLWVRASLALVAAQSIDSLIFFSLAFAGVLPHSVVLEAMLVGLLVKIVFGLGSIPFLYAGRIFESGR